MKKYKFTALTGAAAIAALTFCSCAKTNDNDSLLNPDSPITVTVWHYYNGVQQTNFDNMVKNFNDTIGFEKGIIVEAYSKSSINELADSVIASVNNEAGAQPAPDIFASYSETAYTLDKLGALADMKPYLTAEEEAEYITEYINEGVWDDTTLKIFPTAKSTEIMMINKTDWDKFAAAEGVDVNQLQTFEGITSVAEKYYNYTDALTPDTPNDGKAFFGRDSVSNYMYNGAKQLGCEYIVTDENGNASINVDKAVIRKLWDNYYVPFVKGHFTSQSRFSSDDAKTGSIISLVCSTTGAAYFPSEVTIGDETPYSIENIVLDSPYFEGSEPYLVQQGAGMCMIKSDKSTEYAGMVFLKWFTEEERNIGFSIGSGYLPVKIAANDFSKVSAVNSTLEKPMDSTMLNTLETAINSISTRPLFTSKPFAKSAELRDYIGDTMQQSALTDRETVTTRVASGEDYDSVISEYTGDTAFDQWYESFVAGMEDVIV